MMCSYQCGDTKATKNFLNSGMSDELDEILYSELDCLTNDTRLEESEPLATHEGSSEDATLDTNKV